MGRYFRSALILLGALIVLLNILSVSVSGQSTGSISGMVLDTQRAPVPGAVVKLMTAAGPSQETVTDAAGAYSFSGLQPGLCTLGAVSEGHTYISTVEVTGGENLVLDAVLPDYTYRPPAQATPPQPQATPEPIASTMPGQDVDYSGAYAYIRNNTPRNATIMCWSDYGHPITDLTGRNTVVRDSSQDSNDRITDVARLLTSTDPQEVRRIMNQYNATYLFVTNRDAGKTGAFYYASGKPAVSPASPDFGLTTVGLATRGESLKGFRLVYSDDRCKIYELEPGVTVSDVALPVAAVTVAVGAGVIGAVFQQLIQALSSVASKLVGFVTDGIKSYGLRLFGLKEAQARKVSAKGKKPILLGLSSQELLIGLICILILGAAFAYAKGSILLLSTLLVFILAAGLSTVVHEAAHRFAAGRFKAEAELKFWDLGTLVLLLTSVLLKTPMGQPGRNITNKAGELSKKVQGLIAIAGPIASLLLALVFLVLWGSNALGGVGLQSLSLLGFKISMLACVYSLMPFEPMEGMRVLKWSKGAWGVLFLPALGFYLYLLIFVLP